MLIRSLFEGSLDIVGDIHGEVDALRALLARLGYDEGGEHPRGRRLVFVGDLCDRGPDSPAVFRVVRGFIERGLAQCVLGNHQLNLLRGERKHGNHWFYDERNPAQEREFGPTTYCAPAEREPILSFIAALPVALERSDLRIVHAAWEAAAIDDCRRFEAALAGFEHFDAAAAASHRGRTVRAAYEADLSRYGDLLKDRGTRPSPLQGLGAYDEHCQMSNPLRVATSGVERITQQPFFASGKWRFVERIPWWRTHTEPVRVVFGHYWRWWNAAEGAALSKGEPNLFADDPPDAWQRNEAGREVAFCIDYSVGARFKERLRGKHTNFAGRLAALRWPERELVFDSEASVR